jgi:hypothetical protein
MYMTVPHFELMNNIVLKTMLYNNQQWDIKYVLYLCSMENYRDRRFGTELL